MNAVDSVQEVVEITVDCGHSERTQIEEVRDGGSERTSVSSSAIICRERRKEVRV